MAITAIGGWQQGAVQWDKHKAFSAGADHTCEARCVGLYIGVSGDVAVDDQYGTEVTYKNVPAGILQGRFSRIDDGNTTATDIVELIYTGKRVGF
jgi:hypothetical protein